MKDPLKRITFDKLRMHPFWAPYEIMNYQIPPQPHFENWVNSKKPSDEPKIKKSEKEEENKSDMRPFSQQLMAKTVPDKEINLLRSLA